METAFVETPSELLKQVDHLSFIEHFKTELLARINEIDYSSMNAIISLSGEKGASGSMNEQLIRVCT